MTRAPIVALRQALATYTQQVDTPAPLTGVEFGRALCAIKKSELLAPCGWAVVDLRRSPAVALEGLACCYNAASEAHGDSPREKPQTCKW